MAKNDKAIQQTVKGSDSLFGCEKLSPRSRKVIKVETRLVPSKNPETENVNTKKREDRSTKNN